MPGSNDYGWTPAKAKREASLAASDGSVNTAYEWALDQNTGYLGIHTNFWPFKLALTRGEAESLLASLQAAVPKMSSPNDKMRRGE